MRYYPAYAHAAVTTDINMPPNLIAVLCGETGARLGLRWSRDLVKLDLSDGDGTMMLGGVKGMSAYYPCTLRGGIVFK